MMKAVAAAGFWLFQLGASSIGRCVSLTYRVQCDRVSG